jgi:Zn-dependent peptidase ImmA (M78 family)/DNA-binding XRE family transcriptional regulator
MDSESENIFGNRLKLARKMAGMSLQDLSDALGAAVTKQALSKYEIGSMKPSGDVLITLSKVLNVKPDYLLRKGLVELGEISFRKKADLTKKDEEAVIEKARDYLERYLEIESILGYNEKFKNPLQKDKISNKDEVEQAAYKLRRSWDLGSNPIPSLIEMLELKGVKILLLNDIDQLDGFAAYTSNGVPLVVINTRDKPIERIRFTVMHELAHLILDFTDEIRNNNKLLEKMCHYFSSCFLIPSQVLIKLIGGAHRTYIEIKELIYIKEYCGMSLRAILHRLAELSVINENYYKRWTVYLSKTYGSKEEPGTYKGDEKLKIFEQLVTRALAEGAISISKAAVLSNTNINELRRGFVSVNQ